MKVNLLENKILPSLLKLATPLVATAFVLVAYNIIDTIWLGRLGTKAVAAAGTIGIYIWISNTIMTMARVGVSVRASHAFGKNDMERTKLAIRNSIQLAFAMGILISLLCFFLKKPLVDFYGLDGETADLAVDYFSMILLGFAFSFVNPVISSAYNSLGNSMTPFIFNTLGLIFNIILDPVLIFGLGPIPGLGIRGAGLATASSQALVTLAFVIYIYWEKGLVYESGFFKMPNLYEMTRIMLMGLPTSVRSLVQALVAIVLNKLTAGFGSVPLAVYSVGSQVESISYMTSEGFAMAMTAFAGQNYGAEKYSRIREMTKKGQGLMFLGGTIIMAAFIIFGESIYQLFLPHDPEAIRLGAKYLLILGLSQSLMNIEIGTIGIFNGIGRPAFPGLSGLVLNILRIPLSLALIPYYGVFGIWIAITISSNLKGIINYVALNYTMKRLGI